MKKIILITLVITAMLLQVRTAEARRGFAVGLGPIGNFFFIDTVPIMHPGPGGHAYFAYRFTDQVAFQTAFFITSQKGRVDSSGDNGILLLGMPTFDIKLYFLTGDPAFDPYFVTGVGMYILTEGAIDNGRGGAGMGANVGFGFDYFLSEVVSLGMDLSFKTIGIMTGLGTPNTSSAIFPLGLTANIAFHF